MLPTPRYRVTDPQFVRGLLEAHPFVTIVSPTGQGLVASHYPVILEPANDPDEIVLRGHLGRPDDDLHEFGQHEILLIVQGPHGYVSPSWYEPGDLVATLDDVVAHLWGVPEVLSFEDNYETLRAMTEFFEQHLPEGRSLDDDPEKTRRAAKGTVGFRLRVTRFQARAKLSQNKTEPVRERIVTELAGDGPYAQPDLAGLVACPHPQTAP